MKGKKKAHKKKRVLPKAIKKKPRSASGSRSPKTDLDYLKKHVDKLWEHASEGQDRLQDLEIHVDLVIRLITILSLEVLKLNPKDLRKMIKQAEKDVIRDFQVSHLEELFRMEMKREKGGSGEGKKGK